MYKLTLSKHLQNLQKSDDKKYLMLLKASNFHFKFQNPFIDKIYEI